MKTLLILAASTAIVLVFAFRVETISSAEGNVTGREFSALENYDIRADASADAEEYLARLRGDTVRPGVQVARSDERFKLDFNPALGVVEVIAPATTDNYVLAERSGRTRATTLSDFVISNRAVFGVSTARQLRKIADYENPDGELAFAHFVQELDGIPVFGAEVKAGFSRRGEMFRVVNSLAPGLYVGANTTGFSPAEHAVVSAAEHVGSRIAASDLKVEGATKFSSTEFTSPITAERFYFPIGNGVARPAWRIFLETQSAAYYVIVDVDGRLLWRKSLTEEQTVPATYWIYGNGSLIKVEDSPSHYAPGCDSPIGCTQPPAFPRGGLTAVGNETVNSFNNLGWIPDTGLPVRTPPNPNITDGNAVETGIDRDGTNGVDDNGWAFGNPTRVFNFNYNPAPGFPPPGEEPLPGGPQPYPPTVFQQGVVTHGFYMINRWHDEMYRMGFTEQAGNFQHFNFGRGGSEGDRVSFEIQDGSGTNGANLSVGADGGRPRLQMFVWTGPTPDRDGALDAQVVLHEMTHGLSNRLIGNASGLATNMSRGMGEGWSDFYALALLHEPADNRFGTYAIGGYATYQAAPGYDSNYYYGLRRFPVAALAYRGPNGRPHNPLTFGDINAGCDVHIGTTSTNPNSAFPRNPIISTSGSSQPCDQVHNMGEVWAVILWEMRDNLFHRHGSIEGNRRAIQYVTDGMKLSPLNPTLIQMRDSILVAAMVSDATDVGPMWRGFATRGLGLGAAVNNPGTGSNNTVVTQSFTIPNQYYRPTRADFDGDGKSDISVFRPSDRIWYLNQSSAGFAAINWGLATDELVPDDFDGDGKTDIAVFRATADGAQPDFYILHSGTFTVSYISWGVVGDVPLSEDFDGDNKADATIYRASSDTFWVRRSTDGSALAVGWLSGQGSAFAGDFDGDGRGDFAKFNAGVWRVLISVNNYTATPSG